MGEFQPMYHEKAANIRENLRKAGVLLGTGCGRRTIWMTFLPLSDLSFIPREEVDLSRSDPW